MEPTAPHGEALLEALVGVSLKVAGLRSVDAVLSAAGQGLDPFGLNMIVAQYRGGALFVRYLNRPPTTEVGQALGSGKLAASVDGLARSFEAGKPVFVEELEAWLAGLGYPAHGELTRIGREKGFGRLVLAPLTVAGRRWGGAVFASNSLLREDLSALSLFAAQLHSAIEAAETIEGLEGRNRELEEIHAIATSAPPEISSQQLLQIVARVTASDTATLHRFEAESGELVMVGEPFGFEGEVIERWRRFKLDGAEPPEVSVARTPAELADGPELLALGFRQFATVVLAADGHPTGLLTLARLRDVPYLPSELRTAEILGAQVSSLLDRARLNAESAKLLRQLRLLYEMTSAGALVGQVNPVMEGLLVQMLDAFPVDGAAIHFVERTQLRLAGWRLRGGALVGEPPTPEFMPIDEASLIGRVALGRKQLSMGLDALPPFTAQNAARLRLSHMLAAPLLVGERMVGTLSLVRQENQPFTAEECKLADSCAVHLAVILEHVRLYDDLKQSYDELAHTQAELVKHERLAALGELAAVMAHEVRNPLGVLFNSLTRLKHLLQPKGESELLLKIMGEEADRLNRIVSDLLDFARPYEPMKKPIALEATLASAIDAAFSAVPGSSARVVTEFPAELPRFQIDEHLVRQAFINLVVNALQAMPRGGTVTVRALPEERDGQLWARIEVRDEGVGIPAETAERIFLPFFTTKATGTGLGLAVVKRIIDAHHGEVTMRARPEGGTTFTVLLPGGTLVDEPRVREDDNEDTQPTLPSMPRQPAARG